MSDKCCSNSTYFIVSLLVKVYVWKASFTDFDVQIQFCNFLLWDVLKIILLKFEMQY